jgi:hypothetical protein
MLEPFLGLGYIGCFSDSGVAADGLLVTTGCTKTMLLVAFFTSSACLRVAPVEGRSLVSLNWGFCSELVSSLVGEERGAVEPCACKGKEFKLTVVTSTLTYELNSRPDAPAIAYWLVASSAMGKLASR